VNLSHVDVILAEVGAIEDYVFSMKHESEQQDKQRRQRFKNQKKQQPGLKPDEPPRGLNAPPPKVMGRAAKILEKQNAARKDSVALQRGHQAKEDSRNKQKVSHRLKEDNLEAAKALKATLLGGTSEDDNDKEKPIKMEEDTISDEKEKPIKMEEDTTIKSEGDADADAAAGTVKKSKKIKSEEGAKEESDKKRKRKDTEGSEEKPKIKGDTEGGVGNVDEDSDLFDAESSDGDDDDDDDGDEDDVAPAIIPIDPEAAKRFKERVKTEKQKQLDEYSNTVEDTVRLHEAGWKDRYYSGRPTISENCRIVLKRVANRVEGCAH